MLWPPSNSADSAGRDQRWALLLSLLLHGGVLLALLVAFSKPVPSSPAPLTIELLVPPAKLPLPTLKPVVKPPVKPLPVPKLKTVAKPIPQVRPLPRPKPLVQAKAVPPPKPIPQPKAAPQLKPRVANTPARPSAPQPLAQASSPKVQSRPGPEVAPPIAASVPRTSLEAAAAPVTPAQSIQAASGNRPGLSSRPLAAESAGLPVGAASSGIQAQPGSLPQGQALRTEPGGPVVAVGSPRVEQASSTALARPAGPQSAGEPAQPAQQRGPVAAEASPIRAGTPAAQATKDGPAATVAAPTPAKAEAGPAPSRTYTSPERAGQSGGANPPAQAGNKPNPIAEAGAFPSKGDAGNQGLPSCAIIVDTRSLSVPISRGMSPAVVESSGHKVWPDAKAIKGVSTDLVNKTSIALFFVNPAEIQLERYSRVLHVQAVGTQPPPYAPKSSFHDYAVVSPGDASRIVAAGLSCQMIFLTSR
ncbi:MAG: hypothetical protein IVW51_07370 [Thermaceae bacterium]|nr:hypothetical protein [Thermaceae bacterium]